MTARPQARMIIAGLGGDTGKSLVSFGLARALRRRGLCVAPFKKGPDFIDAAWLGHAAGQPGRNLDTLMQPELAIRCSLQRGLDQADIAVIEGNRGLFDGFDAEGTHSTASLAHLIAAPVILVVDATKVTRTVAALVLGCKALDPDLPLAGVILNRVGTGRQQQVIRDAIAASVGLPVLGCLPKLDVDLPDRHLGLVPAAEHARAEQVLERLADICEQHVDLDAVLAVARGARPLPRVDDAQAQRPAAHLRIGVLRDRAFSFYYPENLEALEQAGAELVEISPLADATLPEVDAIYAGGGFPEVYAAELAANASLRAALHHAIERGLPVYAECGGLVYLARTLIVDGTRHSMVGALPVDIEMCRKPQGHGYVQARVDGFNPTFALGTPVVGHEFHYTRIVDDGPLPPTTWALDRGAGVGEGRDGLRVGSVIATYSHLHALGAPGWAPALVRLAASHAQARRAKSRKNSSCHDGRGVEATDG